MNSPKIIALASLPLAAGAGATSAGGGGSFRINSTSCSFVRAGGNTSPVHRLCSSVSRLMAPLCQADTCAVNSFAPSEAEPVFSCFL